MMTTYDPASTLLDARTRYFTDNGFGDDGGYGKRWVMLKVGPLPFAIPNTQGRIRAVRYHDLHHVLTGYATDWVGESEISAWELASGCRDMWAAWVLNLGGMGIGLFLDRERTRRAFVRGRHSHNLYHRAFDDALLSCRLGALRAELGLDRPAPAPTPGDLRAFRRYAAASLATLLAPGLLLLAVLVALLG
jgi:hypothetical protein